MAEDEASSGLDPGAGMTAEVERGMASMIEQHTQWLELAAAGQRGEEYDWRTSELLSCLRSIEWDLQDLEDAVSIVDGNRQKFSEIDDDSLTQRRDLIDSVRQKIDSVRESVQEAASADGGHAARVKKGGNGLPGLKKECKYGKLEEEQGGGTPKGGAVGAASAALAAMSAAARSACASGTTSSSHAAGGATSGVASDAERQAAAMELEETTRRRRWWLWCC